MRIYREFYDSKSKHYVYEFFGMQLKVKNKQSVLYEYIDKKTDAVFNIFDNYYDITKFPKAKFELRELQLTILELFKRIIKLCNENHLTYWLEGGTLLGAVRHKGFIPWDDDLDICMPREDYEKMLTILKKEFKNDPEYYVRERAVKLNYYQIRIRNHNRNVGLDIFPVDEYFKSDLTPEEIKEITAVRKKAVKAFNKKWKEHRMNSKEVAKSKADLLKFRDEIIMKNNKPAQERPALFYGIDFPYNNAKSNTVMNYETVYPLKTMQFEDLTCFVPNDEHTYLKNLYGNYMSFPR